MEKFLSEALNMIFVSGSRSARVAGPGRICREVLNMIFVHASLRARNKKIISGRFSPVFQYRVQICEIIFLFLGLLYVQKFYYILFLWYNYFIVILNGEQNGYY